MAGVLFIVCVPTSGQENKISEKIKSKSYSDTVFTATDEQQPGTPKCRKYGALLDVSKRSKSIDSVINVGLGGDDNEHGDYSNESLLKSKSDEGLRNDKHLKYPSESSCNPIRRSWDGFKDLVSSARKKQLGSNVSEDIQENGDKDMTMEKMLQEILKTLSIDNAVWCDGKDSLYYQVLFSVESGPRCEEALRALKECGIGVRLDSVVSVIPCTLYYRGHEDGTMTSPIISEQQRKAHQKNTAWNRFVQSVRARLTVAQVVESVKADATLTFDFLILLIIAAFVAAIGLVENSTVFLVSSMLISPLMGPIIAGTFGTVIQDRSLLRMGVLNELLGLLLATVIGFLFGLCICSIDDHYGVGEWPTNEMLSKSEIRSLWVGALIALPSGAAVAIAVLGDNTGSLVGVAISASLLPPAVNAGLLWAMACTYLFWENDTTRYTFVLGSQDYSSHQAVELFILGAISLCLTLVNIVCIYVAGVFVFKIKEVAPLTSKNQRQFWKHDIKIARDYNKTLHGEEARIMGNEIAGYPGEQGAAVPNVKVDALRSLDFLSPDLSQATWSPMTSHVMQGRRASEPQRPTVQQLEALYLSLTGEQPQQPPIRARRFFAAPLVRPSAATSRPPWSPTCEFPEASCTLPPIPECSGSSANRARFQPDPTSHLVPVLYVPGAEVPPLVPLHPVWTSEPAPTSRGPRKFIVTPAVDPLDI